MLKGTKNIHLIFVWLIGLMLFTHGITPHHHHFDSIFEHASENNHSDGHSDEDPSHCHAFNDMVFVGSEDAVSVKTIDNFPMDFVLIKNLSEQYSEFLNKAFSFFEPDHGKPIQAFNSNTPTRGSPVFFNKTLLFTA